MILGRGDEDLRCTKGRESWGEGSEGGEEICHKELESGGGGHLGKESRWILRFLKRGIWSINQDRELRKNEER